MKIVRSENTRMKLRADLTRLSTPRFLDPGVVQQFLKGAVRLDYSTAKIILNADNAIRYIEKFKENGVLITKADHIIALLCIFSDDSMGTQILSEDFFRHTSRLQQCIDDCHKVNYHGILSAVMVLECLSDLDFVQDTLYDVWFLLYNFFLIQSGVSLILEDTDVPGASLLMDMKYKVENYAKQLH